MSSLQVGLAVAGGLVLGGVIAYNTWNARRNAPRQAEPELAPPASPPADPASGERIEPALVDGGTLPAQPQHAGAAVEPGLLDGVPLVPPPERPAGLDALIDVIVPIQLFDHVVSGDAVLAALPATRRVGSKPLAVEGRRDGANAWEAPLPGARYSQLQAGVQLANRNGPLNEIEYSEFVAKVQAVADALGGTPEFGDMLHEVARARELDQFASRNDAELGFVVRARQTAWSPGYVQQQAARLGFTPGAVPGRMVLPAPLAGMPPLLSLNFDPHAAMSEDPAHTALHAVALSLDVTHVPRELQPFERLRSIAGTLAETMDGVVTDDDGHPLRPDIMDAIGADLELLYATLQAHDLAAGSPQARRLFS